MAMDLDRTPDHTLNQRVGDQGHEGFEVQVRRQIRSTERIERVTNLALRSAKTAYGDLFPRGGFHHEGMKDAR